MLLTHPHLDQAQLVQDQPNKEDKQVGKQVGKQVVIPVQGRLEQADSVDLITHHTKVPVITDFVRFIFKYKIFSDYNSYFYLIIILLLSYHYLIIILL